jgi:hypothetical protein
VISITYIKFYIVNILALLLVLFANNTAFAIEKKINLLSQNYLEVELAKQTVDFVFSNDISDCDFSYQKNYIRLDRVESVGKVTRVAAKSSTKLLPQFAKSTIDDAVSLTMKQKSTHIFANRLHPKPWLNDLATQMGGQRNVINAALQNANGRIIPNASGVFNTPVSVGGVNFTIRGFVNQGTPIINSIFIP